MSTIRSKAHKKIINTYLSNIDSIISSRLNKKLTKYKDEDTIFNVFDKNLKENLEICHKIHQLKMIEGFIAQDCIGNFYGWKNLDKGYESGCDVMKDDGSILIEIKNKYSTCNSSSKKNIFDRLSIYKKNNKNTKCIYGIINPKNKLKPINKKIIHNNREIFHIEGYELFKIVFNIDNIDYSKYIINEIKKIIKKEIKLF
jgi:hypothetical protein